MENSLKGYTGDVNLLSDIAVHKSSVGSDSYTDIDLCFTPLSKGETWSINC